MSHSLTQQLRCSGLDHTQGQWAQRENRGERPDDKKGKENSSKLCENIINEILTLPFMSGFKYCTIPIYM